MQETQAIKHNNANDIDIKVDKEALLALHAINSWRHAWAILFNWLIIAACMTGCVFYFNPFIYLLTVIIIGARMHALAILMHDASHYRFLKNRKLNDLITNVTTMYPLFTTIAKYRQNHLRHHKHLNSQYDPDWAAKLKTTAYTFPKTKRAFLISILSYLFLYRGALDAFALIKRFNAGAKKLKTDGKKVYDPKFPKLAFYICLLAAIAYFGIWLEFLIFWFVPYLSTLFMFQYIRSVAEHFGEMAYDHLLTSSRTVKATWYEKMILAPHNVGYHLDHHLYPAVPYYNLPKLHRLLMKDRLFSQKAHVTKGYVKGLLNELGQFEKRQNEALSATS